MTFKEDLEKKVKKIFKDSWNTRDGRVVPSASDIALGNNDAIEFEIATVLYADLSGSTKLVDEYKWQFAAEIYKTYLLCAAEIIRKQGGVITSYDGDRIMAVFIGDSQTSNAANCGLKINYAVTHIVNPAMKEQYSTEYVVKQVVGIDTSLLRVARTGVRGDNDLVWVGRAANYAAKLTELNMSERTFVTDTAYGRMNKDAKFGGDPKQLMWKGYKWTSMHDMQIYGSTWWRSV